MKNSNDRIKYVQTQYVYSVKYARGYRETSNKSNMLIFIPWKINQM